MQTDEEPYTGPFAFIRNRKIPIMNADGGSACICVERKDISNAELRSTGIVTLLPAPGPGKAIWLQHCAFVLRVPTGSAFVGTPAVTIGYSGLANIVTTTNVATALDDNVGRYINLPMAGVQLLSSATNTTLGWALASGLTGNAANDNTVSLYLTYVIIDV